MWVVNGALPVSLASRSLIAPAGKNPVPIVQRGTKLSLCRVTLSDSKHRGRIGPGTSASPPSPKRHSVSGGVVWPTSTAWGQRGRLRDRPLAARGPRDRASLVGRMQPGTATAYKLGASARPEAFSKDRRRCGAARAGDALRPVPRPRQPRRRVGLVPTPQAPTTLHFARVRSGGSAACAAFDPGSARTRRRCRSEASPRPRRVCFGRRCRCGRSVSSRPAAPMRARRLGSRLGIRAGRGGRAQPACGAAASSPATLGTRARRARAARPARATTPATVATMPATAAARQTRSARWAADTACGGGGRRRRQLEWRLAAPRLANGALERRVHAQHGRRVGPTAPRPPLRAPASAPRPALRAARRLSVAGQAPATPARPAPRSGAGSAR